MGEASGTVPPGGQVTDETNGPPPPDAEVERQTAQLEGIERDLDTVDAALSALDSDDLEGAEALAAGLEDSAEALAAGLEDSTGDPAAGDSHPAAGDSR